MRLARHSVSQVYHLPSRGLAASELLKFAPAPPRTAPNSLGEALRGAPRRRIDGGLTPTRAPRFGTDTAG